MSIQPTILDLKTGKSKKCTHTFSIFDVWWWTEGNGSCDCNRILAMGHDWDDFERCECRRFILVDVDGDFEGWTKEEILAEANLEYYGKLSKNYT